MIYFVQVGIDGPIKIGYTKNMANRLIGLQSDNPYKLIVLGVMDGDVVKEGALHIKFDEYRIRGEWFWPVKPILSYIESNTEKFDNDYDPKKRQHKYSEYEIDYIKETFGKVSAKDIAKYLDRSMSSIITVAKRLGLTPDKSEYEGVRYMEHLDAWKFYFDNETNRYYSREKFDTDKDAYIARKKINDDDLRYGLSSNKLIKTKITTK
jgi:hypothetical protein